MARRSQVAGKIRPSAESRVPSPAAQPKAAPKIPGFRAVPFTGVIYVMAEAGRLGYQHGHPDWCNLGQGQPETGPLPGAPSRTTGVEIAANDQDYAPVAGIPELREAVAELYNHLFRRGQRSRYTMENVCICGGGRLSLTRTVAALGHINLGHFLPDYTAYEELLDVFRPFTAIPVLLDGDEGYRFTSTQLRHEITGRGLSAVLLSNPNNPTWKVIHGEELGRWVGIARELRCTLLLDEFYSHYVWDRRGDPSGIVSAARYVKDVDRDPVVILDGFTKNWRYPGWRCTWVLGPRAVIEAVSSTGSFLDGGGNRPLQRAAVELLQPAAVLDEAAAIRAALQERVICVPGDFFDINPGRRRSARASRFRQYARFSFGPEESVVAEGVRRLTELIHRAESTRG